MPSIPKGINSLPSSQIPEQWSKPWFINFLNTWLAAADVRNATAIPPVTITGQGNTTATISVVGGLGGFPLYPVGADPTGAIDSTDALQAWIAACESSNGNGSIGGGIEGYLPAGTYKISNTLVFTKEFVSLRGAGGQMSVITMSGVAKPIFSVNAIATWRPTIQAIGIIADSNSGYGFDLSAITGTNQVTTFTFRDLVTYTGQAAIYATNMFSGVIENWTASSYHDHAFKVICGVGMSWISPYAASVPSDKAGYRLSGNIAMYSPNGVNPPAGYWGIFGQNPSSGDSFYNDFPGAGTLYPLINITNPNLEAWSNTGILVETAYQDFYIQGGSVIGPSNSFTAIIEAKQSPYNAGSTLKMGFGNIILQGGAPSNSNGYLLTDASAVFEDITGALNAVGISSYYSTPFAGTIPTIVRSVHSDVTQGYADYTNAISPYRLSVQMLRYNAPTLTPAGSNQNINVTGSTKVIVTPAASCSISTASFSGTQGSGQDFQRNGDLIIEASNSNLTINHNASGTNTFRMSGAADLPLSAGQICRFCWSTTSSQWIQV